MSKLEKQNKHTKVFVAMSGGVDSSVAAALLTEQGYKVTGVYMKNWSGDNYGIQADCPWEQEQADARRVCEQLDIPFRSFNFERHYRKEVVDYFFSEYEKGRTPNPDILCNSQIKFGHFLDKSIELGADMIATGHYAQVREVGMKISKGEGSEGSLQLYRGRDRNKDQTYFLNAISQEQLSRTLFPIGHLPKSKVRQLAHKYNLHVADKPDSQGICFIGQIDVLKFLQSRLPKKTGNIVDIDTNEVVGAHDGAYFYTRGQRKGLKIGGQANPYFVVRTDVEQNIVYVGHGHEHPGLLKTQVWLEDLHLITKHRTQNFTVGQVKLRSRS